MGLVEDHDRKLVSFARAAKPETSEKGFWWDPSLQYIFQLLDDFAHDGPNGVHQSLVLELLGPTVDMVLTDYSKGKDKLQPEEILGIST